MVIPHYSIFFVDTWVIFEIRQQGSYFIKIGDNNCTVRYVTTGLPVL